MPDRFKTFDQAVSALPLFIGGIDLIGQHKTIADLAWAVQHEIDLYSEGEDNEIACRRKCDTAKRLQACHNFLSLCGTSYNEAR